MRLLLEHPSFEILLLYWEGFSPDEVARVLVNSPDRPRADSGEDAYVQWYKRTIQNALENGEMTDVDR